MKLTMHGVVQGIAFIVLTLLATALLVAAGLNERDASPSGNATAQPPHVMSRG
jgi:hypothetical protein